MKQAIGGVLKHLTLRPNIRRCRYVLSSGQSAFPHGRRMPLQMRSSRREWGFALKKREDRVAFRFPAKALDACDDIIKRAEGASPSLDVKVMRPTRAP